MASKVQNGHANGANGASDVAYTSKRFSDVPNVLDIPVQDQDDEAVEIDLTNLMDDPSDLCDLFEAERAARTYWMAVALAYAKQNKVDYAIETLLRGIALQTINQREKLSMISCLCWMYLWKSREAPRIAPEGQLAVDAKTKEYYLQQATTTLNKASLISPASPPLLLARGVFYLLRASLQQPSKSVGVGVVDPEKAELLQSALKSFEDAIRVSSGRNMLAVMGKARALFSMAKYPEALSAYQQVLTKMPDMVDPDPRIGIGCCFWQLGFKSDAKIAWERALEISPNSKVANILLGLYWIDSSGHVPTGSTEFIRRYTKAISEYTKGAFKLDKEYPLTCATFAGYFASRGNVENVDKLAHKAIQYTDVNAIASDGWYLLARQEHKAGDLDSAHGHYQRADDARGGDQRGYLPAKFGQAQLLVLKNDLPGARYHLEKMKDKYARNHETMTLLGTIYAEEVFANEIAQIKENKSHEAKQAIQLLESVRAGWKDPSKNIAADASVLLNLARLYESEQPDKALECLQQVEAMELDQLDPSAIPSDITDETAKKAAMRRLLSPQLLNNIGCFHSHMDRHELASEILEAAAESCMRMSGNAEEDLDVDAVLTTISFNLGRSYESRGLTEKAVEAYEHLLDRHKDYTDARTRLAYIKLRLDPNKEGPEAITKLYNEQPSDVEVRSMYGWFLSKVTSKKRPQNLNEDHEYRVYKKTLQQLEKHDRYALVAMGNMHLMLAREMRRETEADKQRRTKEYTKAVEFFDKALQLDPHNAYAAQGIGIALAEDKKDFKTAQSILLSVRETLKDANFFVNLGHILVELHQLSKACEAYETALTKDGKAQDGMILSCLGRTWLNRGRNSVQSSNQTQKVATDIKAFYKALEFAKKALATNPTQVHFKFNVAFVQMQVADVIQKMQPTDRSVEQLEKALEELDEAIKTLKEVAESPHTPYPKHDIEQRATMATNTLRNQVLRATGDQQTYEETNKEKIQAAKAAREAETRRRDEEKRKAEEQERQRQEELRRKREEISARDREEAEKRAQEERERLEAELTTDSETGERVKRKRKPAARAKREGSEAAASGGARKGRARKSTSGKKKKPRHDDESDRSETEDDDREERQQPAKKRRRLGRKSEGGGGGGGGASSKYKSAEFINDSDEDSSAADKNDKTGRGPAAGKEDSPASRLSSLEPIQDSDDEKEAAADRMVVDHDDAGKVSADEDEATVSRKPRQRRGMVVSDDEDEDEEERGEPAPEEDAPAADVTMQDASDDE